MKTKRIEVFRSAPANRRIEGAWMVIGQGAGVAAALAAKENVPVQELKYAKLRERLLAQKQVLDLPEASEEPTAIAPRSAINPKTCDPRCAATAAHRPGVKIKRID